KAATLVLSGQNCKVHPEADRLDAGHAEPIVIERPSNESRRILALSEDRWLFREPAGHFLKGRFSGACRIVSGTGSFSMVARLIAYSKDIAAVDIFPEPLARGIERASAARRKLIQIAMARRFFEAGEDGIELATSKLMTSEHSDE